MKKCLLVFLCFVMYFSLCSCQKEVEPVKQKTNKASVILMLGQSNMEGWSWNQYAQKLEDYDTLNTGAANVRLAHFKFNKNTNTPFQAIKFGLGVDANHFGPEIGINSILAKDSSHKYYLIKYAIGGSSLYKDWISPSSGTTGAQYKAMQDYVFQVIQFLVEQKVDFELTHILFMQGEADADTLEHANGYAALLKNFKADICKEFNMYAAEDGIQFIDGGISNSNYWPYYLQINAAKKELADADSNHKYIDTIAAQLDFTKEPETSPDLAHYDASSMIKLGKLFGEEIIKK